MAQAEDAGKEKKKEVKKKWKMEIRSWLGTRQTGEWVRETVATMIERTYERHTNGVNEEGKKVIVKQTVTELVYIHDGYRPHLEGEKETRKSFFHRGARVWR